jgi:hypothetical protein
MAGLADDLNARRRDSIRTYAQPPDLHHDETARPGPYAYRLHPKDAPDRRFRRSTGKSRHYYDM